MAENRTQPTNSSVTAFINGIEDKEKRADARKISAMMKRVTDAKPKMWGSSIVGFGQYHYKYESGREGDFILTGFSARKQALTIYIMNGFEGVDSIMSKLGKYKTGKSCLYSKHLSDVDQKLLQRLISRSVQTMRKNYETR